MKHKYQEYKYYTIITISGAGIKTYNLDQQNIRSAHTYKLMKYLRKEEFDLAKQQNVEYKLGCEISPNRDKIDAWLNEGKPYKWISAELKKLGDYISPISISKYAKHRDEIIMRDLQETPEFQAKQMMVQEQFNHSVAKIQKVDLIGRLSEVIEDSAKLLEDAKMRGIQINSVKDLRMVQQTMLDAVKIYGETMLNAQKFQEIQNDPSLLQNKSTTININVRDTLTTILKEAMNDGSDGYELIDRLRAGIGNSNRE
jgi:hypothetical protein